MPVMEDERLEGIIGVYIKLTWFDYTISAFDVDFQNLIHIFAHIEDNTARHARRSTSISLSM